MAELGDIKMVNPNAGVSPVDTRMLEQGVRNAFGLAEKVITDTETAKVEDQVDEAVDAIKEGTLEVDVVDVGSDELSDSERAIQTRVLDLKADIEQGPSNYKLRAQAEINRILADVRVNNPKLYPHIAQKVQEKVNISPEMQQFGALDAASAAQYEMAVKKLDEMQKHAAKSVGSGGLGLGFDLDFSNPENVREYHRREQMRVMSEGAELEYSVRKVMGVRNAQEGLDIVRQNTIAIGSRVNRTLESVNEQSQAYFRELQKPAEEQDPNVLDNFEPLKEQFEMELLGLKSQLLNEKAELSLFPGLKGTPEEEEARLAIDDRIEAIDEMIRGLEGRGGEGYADRQAALYAARGWGAMTSTPEGRALAAVISNRDLINAVGQMGPQGALARMEISRAGSDVVRGLINGISVGVPETGPDMVGQVAAFSLGDKAGTFSNPQDIINAIRMQQNRNPNGVIGAGDHDDTATLKEVNRNMAGTVANIQGYARLGEVNPEVAARVLTHGTYSAVAAGGIGNLDRGTTRVFLGVYSDPDVVKAIQDTGDGQYKNERLAFADAGQNVMGNTNSAMVARRNESINAFTRTFNGVPVLDLVTIDLDRVEEEGVFSYKIKDSAIADLAWQEEVETRFIQSDVDKKGWLQRNQLAVSRLRSELTARLDPAITFIGQDVRSAAHINFAGQGSVQGSAAPNYLLFADREGYLDIFNRD